ncbi:DUF1697 domain-containing protein [Flavobacterium sp.]|jgi:uncharacterized protein (DUF1697 family)|uniref:DUF1697 domain-containing protein n=1 Tax=Flavobacterium sp. TaxID=239 RepID=UPI0037BF1BED
MIKYLALLRGINVSGHNMIKMDALKKMLENMGFQNVETYIQSGNIFFDSEEENAASVGFKIKQEISKVFGYDVPVIMVSKTDLELCFKNNPYLKEKECDIKKLYVAFISKELTAAAINDLKISNFKPDEAAIDSNRIYIKYAIGAGKTNLDQKYIEKKLNVVSTIRNWNTVTKLLEMYNS